MAIDFNTLNSEEIIDVRDIIDRVEELEAEMADLGEAEADNQTVSDAYHDAHCERLDLIAILDDLKGYGGDEQWRGDWYPVTLIRESYFTDYCQELCEDIGAVPRDLPDYIAIDWDVTARNLMVDYSTVEIDGVTYFYR